MADQLFRSEPIITVSELVEMTGIGTHQVRDWRIRGYLEKIGDQAPNRRWFFTVYDALIVAILMKVYAVADVHTSRAVAETVVQDVVWWSLHELKLFSYPKLRRFVFVTKDGDVWVGTRMREVKSLAEPVGILVDAQDMAKKLLPKFRSAVRELHRQVSEK
ncbi:hypothetical protein AUC68_11805 [Methyloceanibacter methanicus]|uniref:HTH merR-type domain-containing protein n=1 Tax=Methyloceanibacter methanicus TaxID=1774968 RepID=A0A1E3W6D9_9HYPH|nr:hypothetical protein [Methyloceanibacter methanicus]ODS01062.1 hypothetical protein AUC68_11805 [Methyloceanibacter methanicus]